MTRIDQRFADLKAKGQQGFVAYITAGDPDLETTRQLVLELDRRGVDVVELGVPFSDPLADGPVIQKATQIALENGITVKKSLEAVAELRRRGVDIPLVLMGYYNPMLAYGLEKFVSDAQSAGADGFIIPDLPPEESEEFESLNSDLPLIRMLAPTTPPERMETVARGAKGFIYLVSVTGVTGARQSLAEGLGELIASVRQQSSVPVCVGFGIGTPEQAQSVGALADGVIVGSACVRAIGESNTPVETAREFARSFSGALKKID